jgi:hypothetical protein
MPRIQPVEKENAPEQTRHLIEQGEQALGQELNFLKQFAVSPAAFQAFLSFDEALGDSTLDTFTHESIYIGTSNYNGCVY